MKKSRNIGWLLLAFLVYSFSVDANAQRLKCKEKKSVKRLNSHISYLASDRLEGRSTGSEGEMLSAKYLAAEFQKIGLEPKGENGTYLQEFTIVTLRISDPSSHLKIGEKDFKLNRDFYPLSYSSNSASVKADVVDCSFGIKSKDRNDFENLDLQGKIALINASSPDGIHPHSKWTAYHGIQVRVDQAVKLGATGVLFYTNDQNMEEPSGELAVRMNPSNVPVVYLKRSVGEKPSGLVDIEVSILTDSDEGHNVLAFIDNGAENTVIIGAHHDHLGRGEHGGSLSTEGSEIHNGADDNASGTAGLLELAKRLVKQKKGTQSNNYLFAAFSGEEMGLLGSKYMVEHMPIPLDKINYMLNMDMVGMLDSSSKTLVINGVGSSPSWLETIGLLDKTITGIEKVKTTGSGIGASDHTSFYLKGIPSVHFFTGQHPHYHKPTDDIENLNIGGEVRVLNYMYAMIETLDSKPKLSYQKTKNDDANKRRSFTVTLGIIPDYIYDGEGLRVDGVRDGKPGQRAGMKDGDIIVSLGGKSIKGIKDYMSMLSELKKGDLKKMQVRRNGEIIDLEVQF